MSTINRIATVDIGGTRMKAGIFENGILIDSKETDTNAKNGATALLETAGDLIASFKDIQAIGISTAGQVDPEQGLIRYANENLPGYTGTHVAAYFENRFHVPCAVINDAYAAALGEGIAGAAKEYSDYICITYGTGVGGGVILDHKPYYGIGGSANLMIGGLLTHPELRDPTDPFAGSYERCASTTALVARAKSMDPTLTNGRQIFERIQEERIQQIVNGWLEEITTGLLSILHVYNVPCIVLGGGILEQPYVLEGLKTRVHDSAIPGFENVKLVSAQLGNQAGLYGACANITTRLRDQ